MKTQNSGTKPKMICSKREPYRSIDPTYLQLCYQPINFTLQFIPSMLLEAETKLRLRHFISTFLISGVRCLGPQCNFICGGFEDTCEIIPSKCIVDVLELKYSTKNPYAPTLVDFLSSHQGLFGTVRPLTFTTFPESGLVN